MTIGVPVVTRLHRVRRIHKVRVRVRVRRIHKANFSLLMFKIEVAKVCAQNSSTVTVQLLSLVATSKIRYQRF